MAISLTEEGHLALYDVWKYVIWYRILFAKFYEDMSAATVIWEDDQGEITLEKIGLRNAKHVSLSRYLVQYAHFNGSFEI